MCIRDRLAFDSRNISPLLPIQLFTYQFLHGGVWHLLVNALGLFFIGRALEPVIGRREIIGLYLVSGVVGALFQLGFAAVFPAQFAVPVVGSSAAGAMRQLREEAPTGSEVDPATRHPHECIGGSVYGATRGWRMDACELSKESAGRWGVD